MIQTVLLSLAGGLVLFLFALNYLSGHLEAAAGDRLKSFLDRFTSNLVTGILTGVVVTILLDSSSAVIIMTIALVSARAMTFRQAMGVVMGANIGTTVSSQLIALDVGKYASVLMLIGFVMMVVAKSDPYRSAGRILLGFGLIFFSLFLMQEAVEPLRESPQFIDWMVSLENPLKGIGIGALVTLVIQSSSATVGMVIVLCAKKLMTLSAGIAVMLGAELGTCSDTLLASIGRSRPAVKTGLFHLSFNLISIFIGFLLFTPFVSLVEWISGNAPLGRTIANAHMLFNIGGVLLFIPLVPLVEKGLNKMLPTRESAQQLQAEPIGKA